jgi:parallel beta-helix repeat protein
MRSGRRILPAVGVLVVLAIIAGAGWWYQRTRAAAPGPRAQEVTAIVTNGNDRGPGSLREALFVVASTKEPATISIQARQIALETALPPIVTARGLHIVAQPPGAQIDARALMGTVFDVTSANTTIEGVIIRNCRGAAILVRAEHFRLQSSAVEGCDVGVEVAENAAEALIERNRFTKNRIGVRFAAATRNTSLVKNEFAENKDAGLWAVGSAPDTGTAVINVRDNRFTDGRSGLIAGNVSLLVERNEMINAQEAAVHVVGAGVTVRGNRITGGASMGIIAENARSVIIENNELDGLAAYGIMVRGSGNTLVRNNRMHNCGYGIAFVLGMAAEPSTAVENTIIQPKFNGIDVVGDSPVLRRNQVLRPHALALHVEDFQPPSGAKVTSRPFLDNNTFGKADTTIAASTAPRNPGAASTQ